MWVFLGASFFTYAAMMLAPGDPAMEVALARYGDASRADRETVEWIRETEGLDKPLIQQYAYWLRHIAVLDFGNSLVEQVPVMELVGARFSRTLVLAVAAIVIALAISVPLGILAGVKQGTWMDSLGVTAGLVGVSMPNYWLGLVLIIVFSVTLKWLPSFGVGGWSHIVLPAITLGTGLTAYTIRILRSAIIESTKADHMKALRARGVNDRFMIGRHLIKNAMIPVVTVVGLEFGMILEGAVITETVFSWPGLGELMVVAVSNRDYPLIQGLVLFTAMIFVLINFITDLVYFFLDPMIRL